MNFNKIDDSKLIEFYKQLIEENENVIRGKVEAELFDRGYKFKINNFDNDTGILNIELYKD